jgi:hypothetical protein
MNRTGVPPAVGASRGLTYAEVVAAMTVFGLVLAGLVTAVATQLKLVEALEGRAYLLVSQGMTLQVVDTDPGEGQLTYAYVVGSGAGDVTVAADAWAARLGVARLAGRDVRRTAIPLTVGPTLDLVLDPDPEPFEHLRDVAVDDAIVETSGEIAVVAAVQEVAP